MLAHTPAARRSFCAVARRRPNPHLHRTDMIVTAICGDVRICVVRCSQLALEAQRRWNWPEPETTARWGSHAAFANMYSAFMVRGERVKATLQLPEEEHFAEAISVGEVRGFSEQKSPNSGVGVDASMLVLDRIRYGMRQAHRTSVHSCGDIRRTWQRVYDESEQISTFTCVETSGEGGCCPLEGGLFVGGLTIQALPPADAGTRSDAENFGAETVATKRRAWESNELPRMATLMAVGRNGPEEYLRAVAASHMDRAGLRFGSSRSETLATMNGTSAAIQHVTDLQIRPLDFHCRCSKQAFVSQLAGFSTVDLRSIQQDGGTDLHCSFCAETYRVSADDIGELLNLKQRTTTSNDLP